MIADVLYLKFTNVLKTENFIKNIYSLEKFLNFLLEKNYIHVEEC